MSKNIDRQKMFLLLDESPSKYQQSLLHSQSNSSSRGSLHHKAKSLKQKHQILPEISSPFLKRTVYNMFSQKRLQQLEPFLLQQRKWNVKSQRIQKSKELDEPRKEDPLAQSKKEQSKTKQIKASNKEFIDELLSPKKVLKSISQSKSNSNRIKYAYEDFKKTLEIIQNPKYLPHQKSIQNHSNYPKECQQNNLSSQIKQKGLEFQKTYSKQLQSNGFVLRQKLSKEIYQQQREQIKFIKELVKNSKGLSLSKDIQVKKYAHFFPTLSHLQT